MIQLETFFETLRLYYRRVELGEPQMTEAEYWSDCQYLKNEIDYAVEFFEAQEEINRLAISDEAILKALNADALFWVIRQHSLQLSLFITLGRIFDESKDAHSAHRVIGATLKHPEFFSKNALAARKCAGRAKPDWLDSFMSDTWEPNTQELRPLKKALTAQAKKFNDIYLPIRNKVYAHRQVLDGNEFKLFKKTNRAEVRSILKFLRELIDAIEDLYLNGRKPVLGKQENPGGYPEAIRRSVNSVLGKLAKSPS
jgi:hypothetical protein